MTPRATHGLQFHKDFQFEVAARIAPYLAQLGEATQLEQMMPITAITSRPGLGEF
jgi:maltooligosyltrehalose synthase